MPLRAQTCSKEQEHLIQSLSQNIYFIQNHPEVVASVGSPLVLIEILQLATSERGSFGPAMTLMRRNQIRQRAPYFMSSRVLIEKLRPPLEFSQHLGVENLFDELSLDYYNEIQRLSRKYKKKLYPLEPLKGQKEMNIYMEEMKSYLTQYKEVEAFKQTEAYQKELRKIEQDFSEKALEKITARIEKRINGRIKILDALQSQFKTEQARKELLLSGIDLDNLLKRIVDLKKTYQEVLSKNAEKSVLHTISAEGFNNLSSKLTFQVNEFNDFIGEIKLKNTPHIEMEEIKVTSKMGTLKKILSTLAVGTMLLSVPQLAKAFEDGEKKNKIGQYYKERPYELMGALSEESLCYLFSEVTEVQKAVEEKNNKLNEIVGLFEENQLSTNSQVYEGTASKNTLRDVFKEDKATKVKGN